jgi:hypothetical protein
MTIFRLLEYFWCDRNIEWAPPMVWPKAGSADVCLFSKLLLLPRPGDKNSFFFPSHFFFFGGSGWLEAYCLVVSCRLQLWVGG